MDSRDTAASNLEDITKIDFPRPINEEDVDQLLRYFVSQIDEQLGSGLKVSISYNQNRHYGDVQDMKLYESPDQVIVRKGDTKISGMVMRIKPTLESASFNFRFTYDALERPVFTGIDFSVVPGYEPGEANCDNVKIMENMRKYINSFFEITNKKLR